MRITYFKVLLLSLSLIVYLPLKGQVDQDSIPKKKWLRYEYFGPYAQTERSLGLILGVQGFQNGYVELGIGQGNFSYGEGIISGYGVNASVEYHINHEVVAPKLTFWYKSTILFLGFDAQVNAIYYFTPNGEQFGLRPELGLGFNKLFLNVGYNFGVNDINDNINQYTFSLHYYHTLYPTEEDYSEPIIQSF